MLLVALGQGFSTTKKTTVLVISLKTIFAFKIFICILSLYYEEK